MGGQANWTAGKHRGEKQDKGEGEGPFSQRCAFASMGARAAGRRSVKRIVQGNKTQAGVRSPLGWMHRLVRG